MDSNPATLLPPLAFAASTATPSATFTSQATGLAMVQDFPEIMSSTGALPLRALGAAGVVDARRVAMLPVPSRMQGEYHRGQGGRRKGPQSCALGRPSRSQCSRHASMRNPYHATGGIGATRRTSASAR